MTTQLSKAIKKIESFPREIQNQIAEQLMADLESERRWQKTLSKPQSRLDELGEKALRESAAGKTKKIGFNAL